MSLEDVDAEGGLELEPPPMPATPAGGAEAGGERGDVNEEDELDEDMLESTLAKRDEEGETWRAFLLQQFDEEQLRRYESYRRSALPKAAVRRIMQNVSGQTVPPTAVIVMSGITKVFVGEVVETALDVKSEWREQGPLRPRHLREAHRRLSKRGLIPTVHDNKQLLL